MCKFYPFNRSLTCVQLENKSPEGSGWKIFWNHLTSGEYRVFFQEMVGVPSSGWCSTPNQLLICSSFSRENGHPLLICSSLSTSQSFLSSISRVLRSHPHLEGTPDVSPTVYEGISFFVGVWGSLGYLPRVCGQNHGRVSPLKQICRSRTVQLSHQDIWAK